MASSGRLNVQDIALGGEELLAWIKVKYGTEEGKKILAEAFALVGNDANYQSCAGIINQIKKLLEIVSEDSCKPLVALLCFYIWRNGKQAERASEALILELGDNETVRDAAQQVLSVAKQVDTDAAELAELVERIPTLLPGLRLSVTEDLAEIDRCRDPQRVEDIARNARTMQDKIVLTCAVLETIGGTLSLFNDAVYLLT